MIKVPVEMLNENVSRMSKVESTLTQNMTHLDSALSNLKLEAASRRTVDVKINQARTMSARLSAESNRLSAYLSKCNSSFVEADRREMGAVDKIGSVIKNNFTQTRDQVTDMFPTYNTYVKLGVVMGGMISFSGILGGVFLPWIRERLFPDTGKVKPEWVTPDKGESTKKDDNCDSEITDAAGLLTERVETSELTLEEALERHMSQNDPAKIEKDGRWVNASEEEIRKYLDPSNYDEGVYKYQFLDLSAPANIPEVEMGEYLSNKGILSGHEKLFLESAEKYGVSEVYLAAHAALESGNGTSTLSTGVEINGVTVYNMYGIGGGAQFAYNMGWTTPELAIEGGAKWIAEQYINHPDYDQNTLYKMRWNPDSPGTHQYATDVGWAIKQTHSIKNMYDSFDNPSKNFIISGYSN